MKLNSLRPCLMWLVACIVWFTASMAFAADLRTERVHFKKGAHSAVIQGRIKGYETVDYVVAARAGQSMNVSLATKHGATYFNILAPGENEVAMFNGSLHQNQYEGTLAASGDYKVRVYMMRSAARRHEVARYRLEMIVDGAVQPAAQALSHDATVAGTGFHATGQIPCAMGQGQATGACAFGVQRAGNGNAKVTVTSGKGDQRLIRFEKANAIGYDQRQADSGKFQATKEGDLHIIRIGEERYEIPDAVVLGG